MKLSLYAVIFAGFLTSPVGATTFSSAYGYASLEAEAYDFNTGDQVALTIVGETSVQASAFVNSGNGIDDSAQESTVTITNPTAEEIELYVTIELVSEAYTELMDGIVLTDVSFDSNAFVELGFYSTFASTNGSYTCSDPDYNSGGFDCFGVFQDGYEDVFDTPYYSLSGYESLTFEMEARAFAFISSTVAPVPLPAGALLLLSALGLLRAGRRIAA